MSFQTCRLHKIPCLVATQHLLKTLKQHSPGLVMWSKMFLVAFSRDLWQYTGERSFKESAIRMNENEIPIHLPTIKPKTTYMLVLSAWLLAQSKLLNVSDIQTVPMLTKTTSNKKHKAQMCTIGLTHLKERLFYQKI